MSSRATSLTVYRGTDSPGTFVWSPFVTKLEARLRFAQAPYTAEPGSLSASPKGKIPYIAITPSSEDETNPTLISDSKLIIDHLIDEGQLLDLNAKLSPSDKARDLALRALIEDKLYFYGTYEKWHENYYTMRDGVMASIPWPIRFFIGQLAYRKHMATLYGQGTGRYSVQEVQKFRTEIWSTLNDLLVESRRDSGATTDPEKVFWAFGKPVPTEADATLFGFVCSALVCTAAPDTMQLVKSHSALVDYATRIHKAYFADYEGW